MNNDFNPWRMGGEKVVFEGKQPKVNVIKQFLNFMYWLVQR